MLSPDVNNNILDLTELMSTIRKVDAFSYAIINTSIGVLSPDPAWLGSVRGELTLLSKAGWSWFNARPSILSPIVTQYQSYSNVFSALAGIVDTIRTSDTVALAALDQLDASLTAAMTASATAEADFKLQIQALTNLESVFSKNIDQAWSELAAEEQAMVSLATQVTALQDRVNSLQAKINSTVIADGKNIYKTTSTILYTLVSSAGASIPYLTIAGLVFSIGESAYEVLVTEPEISATLDKIAVLRTALSQEAQAAAMSKAIIHLIETFDKDVLAISGQLPGFARMWERERGKVRAAKNAIQSGAKSADLLDLVSMPAAAATWATLSGFAGKLMTVADQGQPVTISTATSTIERSA